MTPWLALFASCIAVDGDTLACHRDVTCWRERRVSGECAVRLPAGRPARVRLRNNNAPELHEAGGVAAKHALAALVAGQPVRCRIVARDKYHRLVGECSTPHTPSLDDALVASGHGSRR